MDEKDEIIEILASIIRIVDGNQENAVKTVSLLTPFIMKLQKLNFDIRRIIK